MSVAVFLEFPTKNSFCAQSLSYVLFFCDSMDCSTTGSSVHGILQVRILEWVAIPSSRRSSWPRDQTCILCISWIGRQILYLLRHLGRRIAITGKLTFFLNPVGSWRYSLLVWQTSNYWVLCSFSFSWESTLILQKFIKINIQVFLQVVVLVSPAQAKFILAMML